MSSCTSKQESDEAGNVGISDESRTGIDDFVLHGGESGTPFPDLSMTLNQVHDSRCPKGVQCVWAGKVDANLTLVANDEQETVTLGLGEPYTFQAYTVTITSVQPENRQEGVEQSAYVVTFTVDNRN